MNVRLLGLIAGVMVANAISGSARGAVTEWFEGWESGYNDGAWTYNTSPAYWNLITASDAPEGGSYLGLSTYNGRTMRRGLGSADSSFAITFYLKTSGASDYWNYNTITILSSAGNGQIGLVIRGDSVTCGWAASAVTPGTWYQHKLVIRPDGVNGGTCDWYVNDQLVGSNLPFGSDPLLPCGTLEIFRGGNDANLESYIDAISVAAAPETVSPWTEGWESGYDEGPWTYNNSTAYWNRVTAGDAPEGSSYMGMSTYNGRAMSRSLGYVRLPLDITFYTKATGGSDYWNYNTIDILSPTGGGQLGMVLRGDSIASGSASYTVTSGTWYQHKLSIRPDSVNGGTYDWYVNGQLVGSNQAFGGDTLLPCSTFHIFRAGNDAALQNYIDDIQVSQGQPRLPAPIFTPNSPYVFGSKKVTIESPTPEAQIYYTTDGSLPAVGGDLYVEPVTVTAGKTLRAIAAAEGYNPSSAAGVTYISYDQPPAIFYGTASTDGDVSEWPASAWTPINVVSDGNPWDVAEAYYAARWQSDKVYVAVKVRDTSHGLTDGYNDWAGSDGVSVYIHTGTGGPEDYPDCEIAQQYNVGISATVPNTVWTTIGNHEMYPGIIPVPEEAGFVARGRADGPWLYYEFEVTPFTYFRSISGGGADEPATLHVGDTIGLDVGVVSNDGTGIPGTYGIAGYTGCMDANNKSGKSQNWTKIGLHVLALPGDANMDGTCDFADFAVLQNNYNQSGMVWTDGDFNLDDLVTFEDFSILQNNYGYSAAGETATSAAAAGLPCSALGLLILALIGWGLVPLKHRG